MRRIRTTTLAMSLLLASSGAYAQQAAIQGCDTLPPVQDSPMPGVAPIAIELTAPLRRLGAPTGILAQAYDEAQSLDRVLLRQRIAGCSTVASVTAPPVPGRPLAPPAAVLPAAVIPAPGSALPPGAVATPSAVIDPDTYQPRTPYDNTPWRFEMSQNGERMTADAFAEWMEARGVRVARGAPVAAATATAATTTTTTTAAGASSSAVPATTTTGPAIIAPSPAAMPATTNVAPALATPAATSAMTPAVPAAQVPTPIDPAFAPVATGVPPGTLVAPATGTSLTPASTTTPTTIATGSPTPASTATTVPTTIATGVPRPAVEPPPVEPEAEAQGEEAQPAQGDETPPEPR